MSGQRGHPGAAAASAPDEVSAAAVLRRTADGWTVGDEQVPDLTCAMVLADLFAAELTEPSPEPSGRIPAPGAGAEEADRGPAGPAEVAGPAGGARGAAAAAGAGVAGAAGTGVAASGQDSDSSGAGSVADDGGQDEAGRLRMTVSQLERALAVRIRVEQAIGVLAERHRVRPRQAFEQLRSVARARGQRVIDVAGDVIASATNPLLPLPEELSRPNLAQRQRPGNRRRARESQ